MKMSKLFLAASFMSLISLATPAFADTTYTYSGNPFTTFQGTYSCPSECSITGSFTLASPLPANLALATISPSSYEFTDGSGAFLTNLNSEAVYQPNAFYVSTDASGNIIAWEVTIQSDTATNGIYTSYDATYNPYSIYGNADVATAETSPQAGLDILQVCCTGAAVLQADYTPGVWTESTTASDPTPTPEPGSYLLLGIGLLGLVALAARSKRLTLSS